MDGARLSRRRRVGRFALGPSASTGRRTRRPYVARRTESVWSVTRRTSFSSCQRLGRCSLYRRRMRRIYRLPDHRRQRFRGRILQSSPILVRQGRRVRRPYVVGAGAVDVGMGVASSRRAPRWVALNRSLTRIDASSSPRVPRASDGAGFGVPHQHPCVASSHRAVRPSWRAEPWL